MHILWVHNSSSILLSQTFEFLNTSANYKDATGNMFVNAYWSWSPIYFLWLWRVWVVYIYISYIINCILFACFFGLSSKKHRCSWHVLWQNSEPVCRLVDKHVENVSPEDMDGLLCGNVPSDCFFVSKLPAYSYKRIFKKSAKKTSKSLCSKSSLYYHDFKTKFRISNTHPTKRLSLHGFQSLPWFVFQIAETAFVSYAKGHQPPLGRSS